MKTMKDFKGSPGEFKINDSNLEHILVYTEHNHSRVALCGKGVKGCYPVNINEQLANAKLFAASKKLLSESIRYLEILKDLEDNYPQTWARITQGTGIETTNGLEQAINEAL